VDIEVVADLEDIDGDVVIVCAGISTHGGLIDRHEWGRSNIALFEQIADACARRVPHALFILVSNPVELAVKIFSDRLARNRVIGMGAEQDSLRFARAIAHDLGISRQQVLASVLGEHGQWMVPLWSSVELTEPDDQLLASIERMKEKSVEVPLEERVAALRSKVQQLTESEEIGEAYEVTRQALPDARIFIQPMITWRTINSTPNATANATLRLLTAALSNDMQPLYGQVLLSGEILGIHGVCGIPVQLGQQGWRAGQVTSLTTQERSRLKHAAIAIGEYLTS